MSGFTNDINFFLQKAEDAKTFNTPRNVRTRLKMFDSFFKFHLVFAFGLAVARNPFEKHPTLNWQNPWRSLLYNPLYKPIKYKYKQTPHFNRVQLHVNHLLGGGNLELEFLQLTAIDQESYILTILIIIFFKLGFCDWMFQIYLQMPEISRTLSLRLRPVKIKLVTITITFRSVRTNPGISFAISPC